MLPKFFFLLFSSPPLVQILPHIVVHIKSKHKMLIFMVSATPRSQKRGPKFTLPLSHPPCGTPIDLRGPRRFRPCRRRGLRCLARGGRAGLEPNVESRRVRARAELRVVNPNRVALQ